MREELAFGVLRPLRRCGVTAASGDALQGGWGDPGTQVLRWVRHGQQRFQRGLIAAVDAARAAFLVDHEVGSRAGAMVVEIGIEVGGLELLDGLFAEPDAKFLRPLRPFKKPIKQRAQVQLRTSNNDGQLSALEGFAVPISNSR